MAIRRHRWFLDTVGQTFVKGVQNALAEPLPAVAQGDTLDVEIHTLTPAEAGGFRYLDPAGLTCRAGFFPTTDEPPSEGTFKVGFGGSWSAAISVTAPAATVQTALNAVSTISAAGGVTVALERAGVYRISFNTAGARDALLVNAQDAYPSTYAKVRRKITGDVDTADVQRVTLRLNAAASQFSWSPLPASVATVADLNVGNHQAQRITFNVPPVGGQLVLGYGAATITLPVGSDAIDLRTALEAVPAIGAGKVAVSGSFEDGFTLIFAGLAAGDVEALVPSSTALVSATGKRGQISLEGPLLDDMLGDDPSVPAVFELELLEDGEPWTVIQEPVTILNGRIEPESLTIPPPDRILGQGEADVRFPRRLTATMTWDDIVENGFYIHMGGDRVLTVDGARWLPTFFNAGVGNLILRSSGAGYELTIAPGETRRVVVEAEGEDWSIGEDAGVRLWRDGGGSYSGSYQLPQQTAATADSIITRQLLGLESILNSSRMPIIMTSASVSGLEATGAFTNPTLSAQGLRLQNGSGSTSGNYSGATLAGVASGLAGTVVQFTSRFALEFTYGQGTNSNEVSFVATLGSTDRRDLTGRGIGLEIGCGTGAVTLKAHNGTSQSTASGTESAGNLFYRRYILIWDGLRTLQLYRANVNAAAFARPALIGTLTLGANVSGGLSSGDLRFGLWATGTVPANQDAFVQNAILYRF